MKIGILGGGSFGTAMAALLGKTHGITVWCRNEKSADALRTERVYRYLPGVYLPEDAKVTSSLEETADGAELLLLTVPSFAVRETARSLAGVVKDGQKIVSLAKGLEQDSLKRMSEVIAEEIPHARIAVLSGPSHAEEVGRFLPTTNVAASTDPETAKFVQDALMCRTFRVYRSQDVIGAELGGALKNVIALCAGVCDGIGCGHNAKAALITRGIAEISRLGVKMGAFPATFSGLSGIGDLIVTCTGDLSRNRACGLLIGQGYSREEAMAKVGATVEGVYTARAAKALAEVHGVEMPIVTQACAVLFENKKPRDAVAELMGREKRDEFTEGWGMR